MSRSSRCSSPLGAHHRPAKLAALLVPGLAALCASPLWAQTQAAAEGRAEVEKLDVVTVTATRRREPVRDVPLRVETLGAEPMERAGATSLSDYVGGLPGIDVKTSGGPGRNAVTMRGVSVGEQQIATVGMYVDEVAFGSSSAFVGGANTALDLALLDLKHIEVLRGPQGTLYGAGAMGGLLKYVTNEPDSSQFSGKVGVSARQSRGGAMGHTENAVLNVPLSQDVAALRVAAFNDHEGGYIDAVGKAAGEHINDGNTRGARVSLLVEPMSKMKIRLAHTQQDIQRNGLNVIEYDAAKGQPIYGDLTRHLDTGEAYKLKTRLTSGDFEYDFGWARLNAIASSQRLDSATGQDATALLGGNPAFDFVSLDNAFGLRKQTQELRLTSQRGSVEWLLGYYHTKETGHVGQRLWAQVAGGGGDMTLTTTGQPSEYRERALYGDLTWNIGPTWSLTLGARVAKNEQVYTVFVNEQLNSSAPSDDTAKTYLATLRYALDKTSNVYFRAASGYRPGGPNSPAIDANGQVIPGTPATFGHDTLWSYELGYKADLLDKRLNFEAAVFNIDWKDLQQPKAVGASTIVVNAGKARVRGLELAAHYKVDAHWHLDGSLAWTDPKLTEGSTALGPSGSRLPNTAKLAFTLGARYAFNLAGNPSYAGLNVRRVGQRNAGYDSVGSSVPNFSQPSYTLVDAQWGVEMGRWQLATFVRNLTDKRAILGADTALTAFGLPLNVTTVAPRTVGANLTFNF
ncbi:outer membrane receptor protein involved in Fe transport [Pelomonas saccharophila]|uniref:Outer membrane receptor protein involved in Fe transport n=1 Tax=Roseateles saccharophilus TaxID=304 RepID=A0ABU1YV34_ROSSA|nr:TonB-dependent receptor [Roseateles saccharophilus]MDR7272715.1 outer membrane receptor protein involved in Fe transport [Roseateles saccharophilus]